MTPIRNSLDAADRLRLISDRICMDMENISDDDKSLIVLLKFLKSIPEWVTYKRELGKIADCILFGFYLKASLALEHFYSVVPDPELKQILEWVNKQK